MAESSLALGYLDFQREAAKFLGYGPTSSNWTTAATNDIETLLDAGYRQCLYPPVLPGERVPYRWRFLRPTTTLTTVASTGDYSLPDDFDGVDGPIRYSSSANYFGRITMTHRDHILSMRQADVSGYPMHAAITPRLVGGQTTARWTLMLWPTPGGAYTLVYRYQATPPKLSQANPYPVGGIAFGELVMEGILSLCEERKEDRQGIHRAKFVERLVSAVNQERDTKEPDSYGYFGDPSCSSGGDWTRRDLSSALVTYNGA